MAALSLPKIVHDQLRARSWQKNIVSWPENSCPAPLPYALASAPPAPIATPETNRFAMGPESLEATSDKHIRLLWPKAWCYRLTQRLQFKAGFVDNPMKSLLLVRSGLWQVELLVL